MVPQATRPCDDAFAESLGDDPVLMTPVPGDVGRDIEGGGGYCADADDGGVSMVELDRRSTASPAAITTFVVRLALRHGWRDAHVTAPRSMGLAYPGPGVCAHTDRNGHHLTLRLHMDERDGLPPGTVLYNLSITGDEGGAPSC